MLWRGPLKAYFVKDFTSFLVVLGGMEELRIQMQGRSWLIVHVRALWDFGLFFILILAKNWNGFLS